MNFTTKLHSVEESYGHLNESSGAWSGVIGRLEAQQIDVGIGEFTMVRQRFNVIDHTIPLMLTYSDLYIKRPNMTYVGWSAYLKVRPIL